MPKPSHIRSEKFGNPLIRKFNFIYARAREHCILIIPGTRSNVSLPRGDINSGLLQSLIRKVGKITGMDSQKVSSILFDN
jgi:hypothetical protein